MKGRKELKIKQALISLLLIILSLSLLACQTPENVPTEEDLITGGYWYNEDRSTCFKFDENSNKVLLYSLNSGSYTYNFGNVIEGVYSLEECTLTFGENVKYYVRDGAAMSVGEEKFTMDKENVPTLNVSPMQSATEIVLESPHSLVPANPSLNEKMYFKFTPENDGRYSFDFAISDAESKQRSTSESSTTYLWILNEDYQIVTEGIDDITVFLNRSKTYYVIVTVSAVSSETGTNTLTVTGMT